VLVVDDNATNRMVAEALCEMFDCTSESAEDGVEAVEAVKTGRFDLVLMDIKMPRMDGVQATQAIRALDGPVGAIPIVALTANAMKKDELECRQAGMDAHLAKPLDRDALARCLDLHLVPGEKNELKLSTAAIRTG